jgi:putative ABC transport system permease protein
VTLPVAGIERICGLLDPPVLAGRLPAGPEEIAIGRVSARYLDASIGDELRLAGSGAPADYTITGFIVPPLIRGNDLVGEGGVVTSTGYRRLDPDVVPHAAAFRLRPDAPPAAVERLSAVLGTPPDEPALARPPAIRNEARITYVPFVLAALLAALCVLLVMNGAYAAVHRRNHDVAVLRSLGAERRWLVRAATWSAAAWPLISALIGVPLGFFVGSLVFRAYAGDLGTVTRAAAPFVIVLPGVVLLGVLAALAATPAGRTARRLAPARLLHVE